MADLVARRSAFARRLRSAGLTWAQLRDRTDEFLPEAIDHALAAQMDLAERLLDAATAAG